MKHFIQIIALVMLTTTFVYAQKKPSGGGQSPSPSSPGTTPAAGAAGSGSSGSSSLVQGYHYILPKKYHVAYRSILYISPNAVDGTGKWNKKLSFTYFIISTTNPFDPKDIQTLDQKIKAINPDLTAKDIDKSNGIKQTDDDHLVKILEVSNKTKPTPDSSSGRIVIDTVWRYSVNKEHVSVTQGDSGKLVIQFYNKLAELKKKLKNISLQQTARQLSGQPLQPPPVVPPDTIAKNYWLDVYDLLQLKETARSLTNEYFYVFKTGHSISAD